MRTICNNLNTEDDKDEQGWIDNHDESPEDEIESIDITPTWQAAIDMWFFAIRSQTGFGVDKTLTDCQAEMLRLADAYDSAKSLIEELKEERDEARDMFGQAHTQLRELDTVEYLRGMESYDEDEVIEVIRWTGLQVEEWKPYVPDDKPLKTALQSDFL